MSSASPAPPAPPDPVSSHDPLHEVGARRRKDGRQGRCHREERPSHGQLRHPAGGRRDLRSVRARRPAAVRGRDPVAVVKAIDCYVHQSGEHPGWAGSRADRFCQRLRSAAVAGLPLGASGGGDARSYPAGWERAPWGIDYIARAAIPEPAPYRRLSAGGPLEAVRGRRGGSRRSRGPAAAGTEPAGRPSRPDGTAGRWFRGGSCCAPRKCTGRTAPAEPAGLTRSSQGPGSRPSAE